MATIFISYRRSDSIDATGHIFDKLIEEFKGHDVFRDVDSIQPGESFPDKLKAVLTQTDVALIVIGPSWVSTKLEDGRRRIDTPDDFVRMEVALSLGAKIPVIPIVIGNAAMPEQADLPKGIRDLARLQAATIRPDPDFHRDMERLISKLVVMLGDEHSSDSTGERLSSVKKKAGPEDKRPISKWRPLIKHRIQYYPRTGLMEKIDRMLVPGQPCDVAVLGDAGVGKSRLVSEYQHRCRSESRYQNILSITADSELNFEQGVREVSEFLFDSQIDDSGSRLDPITALYEYMETADNWLIVIDNLCDIDLLRRFAPKERNGGHLLITIRPGNGVESGTAAGSSPAERDIGIDAVLDVQSMSREEGAHFLLWSAGLIDLDATLDEDSSETQHAFDFSSYVGGLPLILAAAGRYISTAMKRNSRYGVATFTQAYRSVLTGPRLREDLGTPGSDYPNTAKCMVHTILQGMKAKQELLGLLNIASFFPSDSIPASIFTDGETTTENTLGPLASVVGGVSLLLNEACDSGLLVANGDDTYRMHRVWQQTVKDDLGDLQEQKLWAEHAISMVWETFPAIDVPNAAFLVEPDEWGTYRELAPLGFWALELAEEYDIQIKNAGSLIRRSAYLYNHSANFDGAILLTRAAIKILQLHDDASSCELASCYNSLGELLSAVGGDGAPPSYYLKKANKVFEHKSVDKSSIFYWAWQRTRPRRSDTSYHQHLRRLIRRIRRTGDHAESDINWLALQLPAPQEIGILNQTADPFAQQWLDESFELIERHKRQRTRAHGWLLGMQSDSKPEDAESLLRKAVSILREFPERRGLQKVYDKLATIYMFSRPAQLDNARRAIAEFEALLSHDEASVFLAYCHVMKAVISVLDGDESNAREEIEQANRTLTRYAGRRVNLRKEDDLIQSCVEGIPPSIAEEVFRIVE